MILTRILEQTFYRGRKIAQSVFASLRQSFDALASDKRTASKRALCSSILLLIFNPEKDEARLLMLLDGDGPGYGELGAHGESHMRWSLRQAFWNTVLQPLMEYGDRYVWLLSRLITLVMQRLDSDDESR